MLFQITHTHTPERCPAVDEESGQVLRRIWRAIHASTEVNVRGAFASPLDHVFFFTVEGPDLASVVRLMAPLNAIGTAVTNPVMELDDLIKLVDEGREASTLP